MYVHNLHEYCLSGSYNDPKYCLGRLNTLTYVLPSLLFGSSSSIVWLAAAFNWKAGSLVLTEVISSLFDDSIVSEFFAIVAVVAGWGEWAGEEHSEDADEIEGELLVSEVAGLLYDKTEFVVVDFLSGLDDADDNEDVVSFGVTSSDSFFRLLDFGGCWHLFGIISNRVDDVDVRVAAVGDNEWLRLWLLFDDDDEDELRST